MGAVSPQELRAPERLTEAHEIEGFDSGEAMLDEWLRKRALQNEKNGASRTFVVRAGMRVAGYYTLAVGSLDHDIAPGRAKRNMPNPIPVMILGRLAVDRAFQGKGLGAGLLRDAVFRTQQVAELAGIRALLVHAISPAAKRFYEGFGFVPSPVEPMTLVLVLSEAELVIDAARGR